MVLRPAARLFCLRAALILGAFLLAGCETLTPQQRLQGVRGASIVRSYDDGRPFVIPVTVNGDEVLPFLIDTGSTATALYPRGQRAAGVSSDGVTMTEVRGIGGRELRPLVSVPSLTVAGRTYDDQRAVLLDPLDDEPRLAGIVGLDILIDFVLLWDPAEAAFTFVPQERFSPSVLERWEPMGLIDEIPGLESTGLLFTVVQFRSMPVATLIDTGSELSLMNWTLGNSNRNLRVERRRLRENWVLQGAVGRFEPTILARVSRLMIAGEEWEDALFVVTDLSAFEGGESQPLLLLGANYLSERAFVFDPAGKVLYVKPKPPADSLNAQPVLVIEPS
jgi:hypothetical protein